MATNGSYLTPAKQKRKQLDSADPKNDATSKPRARKPVAKNTSRAKAKRSRKA